MKLNKMKIKTKSSKQKNKTIIIKTTQNKINQK